MRDTTQPVQRKSQRLGLSFPYDWSNPNISDEALIRNVLDRGIFEHVARICLHLGTEQVQRVWKTMPPDEFRDRALRRMFVNIKEGFRCADASIPTSLSFVPMIANSSFSLKSSVIHERVKSRDLYDLFALVRDHGYTLSDVLKSATEANISTSEEYAKEVLIGNIPLDKDDEELEAVGTTETIDAVYGFFKEKVAELEQSISKAIKEDSRPGVAKPEKDPKGSYKRDKP